jgi:hypothetical protein
LQDLTLISKVVSPEQGNILATGLDGVKLRTLNMQYLKFEDNGAFEQIVSVCLGVEDIRVRCYTNSHYTALAALLQNPNTRLQELRFSSRSRGQVSPEQGNILATGLDGVKLKTLTLGGSEFGDGAFEQIVSACVGVESLSVTCYTNSHYTAVAALLRNPLSMMQIFNQNGYTSEDNEDIDVCAEMVLSDIFESLVGNTKLQELSLEFQEMTMWDWDDENLMEVDFDMLLCDFDMLLCNSTTLQNICSSNHTLEKVWIRSPYGVLRSTGMKTRTSSSKTR